jgi:DNA-binding HxlR family transcriptional regulator
MLEQVNSSDMDACRVLLDQLADKWTLTVFLALRDHPLRFNELKRRVPGITQKALTQSLRRLERNGMVSRRIVETAPPGVEYSVSTIGKSMSEPLGVLAEWAARQLPSILAAQAQFDSRPESLSHTDAADLSDYDTVTVTVRGQL